MHFCFDSFANFSSLIIQKSEAYCPLSVTLMASKRAPSATISLLTNSAILGIHSAPAGSSKTPLVVVAEKIK